MLKKGSPFTKSNKKQSKEIHVNADSYNHDMFKFYYTNKTQYEPILNLTYIIYHWL